MKIGEIAAPRVTDMLAYVHAEAIIAMRRVLI